MDTSVTRPDCVCGHPASYHINFVHEGKPKPPGPVDYPRKENFCRYPTKAAFCTCRKYEVASPIPSTPPTDTPELEKLLEELEDATVKLSRGGLSDVWAKNAKRHTAARDAITDLVASLRAEVERKDKALSLFREEQERWQADALNPEEALLCYNGFLTITTKDSYGFEQTKALLSKLRRISGYTSGGETP